jgi:SPP1 family predicted phage head-tail adaptor
MRAGQLRHRITIQSHTSAQDNYGEVDWTWSTGFETWAKISPLRGNQYFNAQQVQANVSHKITLRYQALPNSTDINADNTRLLFGSTARVYNIVSVINPDERNIYLDLMCEEII